MDELELIKLMKQALQEHKEEVREMLRQELEPIKQDIAQLKNDVSFLIHKSTLNEKDIFELKSSKPS